MKKTREQQKQRLMYLNKIYELSDGVYASPTPSLKSGEKLGFSEKLSRKIEKYLEGEGLIEILGYISDGNCTKLRQSPRLFKTSKNQDKK